MVLGCFEAPAAGFVLGIVVPGPSMLPPPFTYFSSKLIFLPYTGNTIQAAIAVSTIKSAAVL